MMPDGTVRPIFGAAITTRKALAPDELVAPEEYYLTASLLGGKTFCVQAHNCVYADSPDTPACQWMPIEKISSADIKEKKVQQQEPRNRICTQSCATFRS
jgi:hypothetical protein